MKAIAKLIYRIWGWKLKGSVPDSIPKFVFIVAPHTSMWDFIIGWLAIQMLGLKTNYMIKKEMFFWPLGPFLKMLGGIPVDRQKGKNVFVEVVEILKQRKKLALVITPEGTRSFVKHWKKGFYRISHAAEVPVVMGYIDYKNKIAGVGPAIDCEQPFEQVMEKIDAFYCGIDAKHPERFNLADCDNDDLD